MLSQLERHQALLGFAERLLDGQRDISPFAHSETNLTPAIADTNYNREAEAPAAADDADNAPDRQNFLIVFRLRLVGAAGTAARRSLASILWLMIRFHFPQNSKPPARAPSASALTRPL